MRNRIFNCFRISALACCWIAVALGIYLEVTSSRVVIYDAWNHKVEIVQGPLRADGMIVEVSWMYVLIPLIIVLGFLKINSYRKSKRGIGIVRP